MTTKQRQETWGNKDALGAMGSPRGTLTKGVADEPGESARTEGGGTLGEAPSGVFVAPDPEVKPTGRRKTYSASYKARIIALADACEPGEVGAMLRREGLYFSTLQRWRRQREEGGLDGLAPRRRGPQPDPDRELRKRLVKLEKENQRLAKRLAHAELIIDVQKKVATLLGLPPSAENLDGDEKQ